MRLWTREQAREIDTRTLQAGEASLQSLVEAAGLGVAQELLSLYPKAQKFVFLAGPGLNGLDALVAAQRIYSLKSSLHVEVWLAESGNVINAEAVTALSKLRTLFLKRLQNSHIKTSSFDQNPFLKICEEQSLIVVDGLFGTGLSRPLGEEWISLFRKLHKSKVKIASIDIPSGVDTNTGEILGEAAWADSTIALGAAKPGHFLREGSLRRGRLRIAPLPFPKNITEEVANSVFLCGRNTARRLFPKRSQLSNKSTHGSCRILAGSKQYRGAAILSATAALRAGAGFAHIMSFEEIFPEWFALAESLFHHLKDDFESEIEAKAWKEPWLVGPGLSEPDKIKKVLRILEKQKVESLLIDASALRVIARGGLQLRKNWILTPHSGEAADLLGRSAQEIDQNRLQSALQIAKKFGCVVLLKGFRTVVADGEKAYIIQSGNSALAKAGTGDVLAGMITAYLAQGLPAVQAAVLGAWLHGALADSWVRDGNAPSALLPQDLVRAVEMLKGV